MAPACYRTRGALFSLTQGFVYVPAAGNEREYLHFHVRQDAVQQYPFPVVRQKLAGSFHTSGPAAVRIRCQQANLLVHGVQKLFRVLVPFAAMNAPHLVRQFGGCLGKPTYREVNVRVVHLGLARWC